MMTILLENIELAGFHGVHPLEGKTGTRFILHASIQVQLPVTEISLDQTIDYAEVYALIKQEFSHPHHLLENLSTHIIRKIFTTFNHAQQVTLTILKKDAPISGFKGQVGVSNCLSRADVMINK
jgi:dihydroneopterin aldolase